MNLEESDQLAGPIRRLLNAASRINEMKPQRYWYPLSVASYDLEEILSAVDSMCSFRTSMWEKTQEFEAAFSLVTGRRHSIMVNSGSSADLLIAFALVNPVSGLLQPGDEVLVPAVTWPTHLWSLIMAGLRPVLVDADPSTLNIDLGDLKKKISAKTRAISIVHLMGNPCDVARIRSLCDFRGLTLVEDCCEALGSKWEGKPVGSFGLAGSYSFFFSHHITTMEGGMVSCDDDELSDLLRLLRAHGWSRDVRQGPNPVAEGIDSRYSFVNLGFNVRPTEVQAAFGIEQLKRLGDFQSVRRTNVDIFEKMIASHDFLSMPTTATDAEASWFALPIMVDDNAPYSRDELTDYLEQQGVETRPIVAGNLARQPAARVLPQLDIGSLPGADRIHERGFYIGLHPFDMASKFDRLAGCLDVFHKKHPALVEW